MCPFVMLQDTAITFSNQVICPGIIRKPIRAYSILIFWVLFTPFALKSAENLLFCVFLVKICPLFTKKTKTLWTLFMDGAQLPQDWSHFEEAIYFLWLSSQKFLVLILLTLEGWKAESTLELPSGFEHENSAC